MDLSLPILRWCQSNADLSASVLAAHANPDTGALVYEQGSAWATGDVVYSASGRARNNVDGYTDYFYTNSFVYPAAQSLYGINAYTLNSYPLKYVTLNSTLSAAAYQIRALQMASLTFTGMDGVEHSVTPYHYYLQNDFTTDRTGQALRLDLGDIDIDRQLQLDQFWLWDAAARERSSVQVYMVRTTLSTPPNFTVSGAAILSEVSPQLTTLATAAQAQNLDQEALDAVAATLGVSAIAEEDLHLYP